MIRQFKFILVFPVIGALIGADAVPSPNDAAAQPAAAEVKSDAGVVTGTVHAQIQPVPPEMLVYLEPKDPARKFPAPEKRVRISQKGAQFSPAFSIVSLGQTVEFLNDEDRTVEHNVYSNAVNNSFDFGLYPPGQSKTFVFDHPGPVVLYCSIHKFMDGAIFVCPTPLFSKVDPADGRYRIEGVPPGEYTLQTWQRRRRFPELSIPVKVDAGQTRTTDLELRRK